jgi:hypothetical protein
MALLIFTDDSKINQILKGVQRLMSQMDDALAALAAANTALAADSTRAASVLAGVQALQAAVTALQAEVAAGGTADLTPLTDGLNSIAATLGGLDTEDTSIPQPPAPAA